MAGSGLGERVRGDARRGRHLVVPLPGRPLGVVDQDRDRRAERAAVAHTAEELDLVGLEAHARPAAVAEPPAGELGSDVVDEDGETRGQALDDDHEGRAVGFARGQKAQHDVPL